MYIVNIWVNVDQMKIIKKMENKYILFILKTEKS